MIHLAMLMLPTRGLVFLFTIFLLHGSNFELASECRAQSSQELIECLNQYQQLTNGLEVKYLLEVFNSKEVWERNSGGGRAYAEFTWSRSTTGDHSELNINYPETGSEGTRILTSDLRLFHAVKGDPPTIMMRRNCLNSLAADCKFSPAGILIADNMSFSDLLKEKVLTLSNSVEDYGGEQCDVLTVNSSLLGNYRFWFSRLPEIHLVRVVVKKESHHLVTPIAGHRQKLSAPPVPAPEEIAGMSDSELAEYKANLARTPATVKSEEEFLFSGYGYTQGKFLPTLIKTGQTAWGNEGDSFFVGASYSVADIRPFDVQQPELARFRHFKVPNGSAVIVSGEDGLGWCYMDGDIARVIDDESIERIDGVRFRKKEFAWPYYLAIFGVLIFVGILIYRLRSHPFLPG
jgi:hypothetical protein